MKRFWFMIVCVWLCTLGLHAQCAVNNEAIQPGEKLTYELKFNWKFIWVNAGHAKMDLAPYYHKGKPAYKTTLIAVSNKTVDLFFKMRDTITTITSERLEPIYYRKGAEEGKGYTVDVANFSYEDGKCIVDQSRSSRDGDIDYAKDTVDYCVFDMLSILLQARSFDPTAYNEGDKINFAMATGREIENQTLIYRGKEIFKAENKIKYRCLVFSLVEYDDDGDEEEVITFFVTDDKNHLPVRLDLYLNFGSAKAFLETVEGNRHPMTSIVEDD